MKRLIRTTCGHCGAAVYIILDEKKPRRVEMRRESFVFDYMSDTHYVTENCDDILGRAVIAGNAEKPFDVMTGYKAHKCTKGEKS